MVLLKGAGWTEVQHLVGILGLMAAIILPAAIFAIDNPPHSIEK